MRSVEHRRQYRPASAESSRGAITRDRSASSSKSTVSRGHNQATFPATCAINNRPQIPSKAEAVRVPERIKSVNFIKTRGACTTFLSSNLPNTPRTRSNLLNRVASTTISNSQKSFVPTRVTSLPTKLPRPTNMVQSIESRPRFNCSPRIVNTNITAKKVPSENLKMKYKYSSKLSEKTNLNQSLQNVSIKKVFTPVNESNIQEKQTRRRNQIETLKNTFCRGAHDIPALTSNC
ncbi:uncharacterized protein LOC106718209 [Papilio machaon]|uniref:uncharacterized protein LOC106718209 n=1 Tax=Papilio machaon TaxID=76193 RepID=UPI001E664E11|nr:uncharacterized protein LOC106718209 [Papilio machaon]